MEGHGHLSRGIVRREAATPYGFDLIEPGCRIFDPETGVETELRSHENQALPAMGDSGGPLFFNTTGGIEVAGILFVICVEPIELVKTGE